MLQHRDAWQKVGKLSKEEAQKKYVALFSRVAKKINNDESRAVLLKINASDASALTASAAAGHESEDRVVHLYGTLLSQPTRSVLWFCQLNNIPVEFHLVNLLKREQKSSEFTRM